MRAGLLLELEEELSELGVVLDHAISEGVHDPSQHREGDPAAGHDDACGSPLDSSNRRRGDTLRGDRRAQRRWPPAPEQFGRDGIAAIDGSNERCRSPAGIEHAGGSAVRRELRSQRTAKLLAPALEIAHAALMTPLQNA